MNIQIGRIVKKLRTEKSVTQDTLAAAIGVTPQAISRWESENGYPDIELLPSLADFFNVTTDELLGYKLSERETDIANIKKEMSRLSEVGTIEERVAFARNAKLKYPSDHEIKENLAVCLYHLWQETNDKSLLGEIEGLCLSVVDECKDEDMRFNAINLLVSIYRDTKQSDKALKAVNLLPPMKYCREAVLSGGIGDGKDEIYIQDEIDKLTDALGMAISNYPLAENLPNDPSTWDKKIEMLEVSNELYRMIYGDDLLFYHSRLAWNDWLISTYQISQGKVEEALGSIEEMCVHAIAYDRSYGEDHGKRYRSIFTDKLIYPFPGKDFHELKEHSQCYYMLDKLGNARYDGIRESERFLSVIESLKQYER